MNFNEYQELAARTAEFPEVGHKVIYPLMGLSGEVGEVSEKIKKVFRDKGGNFDEDTVHHIKKELGDVLWYLSEVSRALEINLDDVAQTNINKLSSRKERDQIHGDGDER